MVGETQSVTTTSRMIALLVATAALSRVASCVTPERERAVATTQPAGATCHYGEIDVRVINPDGSPAANVPVGVFGGWWYSESGEDSPPWRGKARSDGSGRLQRENLRECCSPTFFYAFDESRTLAGFCLVEELADLARPQTVCLRPARWVVGEIGCPELERRGESPDVRCAALTPIREARRRARWLRYAQVAPSPSRRFRFLVPPGEYWLELYSEGAEPRRDVELRVPAGDDPLELGAFDLELSPLVRVIGQPAPPLEVSSWSDGQTRTLAGLRGRPILLVFWDKTADPLNSLRAIFSYHRRLRDSDAALLLVHAPDPGGLAELRRSILELGPADSTDDVEYDLQKWPFPTAIDRPIGEEHPPARRPGASAAAYGSFGHPLFVLIDSEGRVVATSEWKGSRFDRDVERVCSAPQ
jgi:hypothetical protein